MYQFLNRTSFLALIAGALLLSCQGSDKGEPDKISVSDNANVQGMFDDIAKVTEEALSSNNKLGARLSSPGNPIVDCATVEIEVLAPDSTKLTINFLGVTCKDGKKRTGTITAVLDGATYNTPDAVLTVETTDYTVAGTKIEGRKVVTCVSNASNNPVHNIVVSDISPTSSGHARITYPNGQSAVWKSKRTRSLVSGGGNLNILDNIYDISGTPGVGNQVASGVNREGNSYTVNIISALRVNLSCFANNTARYPTQGNLMVTPAGKQPMSIDYGSGACDNQVKITYLGKNYDITLSY